MQADVRHCGGSFLGGELTDKLRTGGGMLGCPIGRERARLSSPCVIGKRRHRHHIQQENAAASNVRLRPFIVAPLDQDGWRELISFDLVGKQIAAHAVDDDLTRALTHLLSPRSIGWTDDCFRAAAAFL